MEWVKENKIKKNVKIKVTPEQSKKVQEICFENGIFWKSSRNIFCDYPFIFIKQNVLVSDTDCESDFEEIDADLFIRTDGSCEEDKYKMFDTMIQKPYDVVILEQKLKKKNEILKKARIKRKNQREELHKLNIKLQKCIDLEAHNIATKKLRDTIIRLKCENIKQRHSIREEQNKEIEKLKAVIEYLESKVK